MRDCVVFIIFSSFFILNISCSSDETKEDLSDIPDWDYANVVGDEIRDGSDINNEATDNSEAIPDEDSILNDTSEETTDDSLPVGCGNEKVEYNERCDSAAPLSCDSLNSSMNGLAYCSNDCLSYNLDKCETAKGAWGIINLRFLTNFILDEGKIGDFDYFQKGTVPYAAFNGIYGDIKTIIPSPGQMVSFSVTANYQGTLGGNKRQLFIRQNPTVSGAIGYPRYELEFAPGSISKDAEYKINAVTIFALADNILKLARFRLIEKDKQNGAECIMGIGYSGSVYITNVYPENLDLYDGGSLEVISNNLIFYYPTEVPGLDENNPEVPAEILKYPVCTK